MTINAPNIKIDRNWLAEQLTTPYEFIDTPVGQKNGNHYLASSRRFAMLSDFVKYVTNHHEQHNTTMFIYEASMREMGYNGRRMWELWIRCCGRIIPDEQ